MSEKPWKCNHCTKAFRDADALWSHHKSKHRNKKEPKAAKAARRGEDESFASRAIQAQIDAAMGIDNPDYDWLVEPYK